MRTGPFGAISTVATFQTDVLVDGTLHDSFEQDSDADYDVSISTSATASANLSKHEVLLVTGKYVPGGGSRTINSEVATTSSAGSFERRVRVNLTESYADSIDIDIAGGGSYNFSTGYGDDVTTPWESGTYEGVTIYANGGNVQTCEVYFEHRCENGATVDSTSYTVNGVTQS